MADDEAENICRKPSTDYDDRRAYERRCEEAKDICEGAGIAGGVAGGAAAGGACAATGVGAIPGAELACVIGGYGAGYSAAKGICEEVVDSTNDSCKQVEKMDDRDYECAEERRQKREEDDGGDLTSSIESDERYAAAETDGPEGAPFPERTAYREPATYLA